MNKKDPEKFLLSVEDADGPIQLVFMNGSSGKRILGSKGSPYRRLIKEWSLTRAEVLKLIGDLKEVLNG